MKQILEYFKIAFFNLKANKMRTFLTMFGIIIGIGSVVMVISSGMGIKKSLMKELNSMVGSYVQIYQGQKCDDIITEEDLEAIKEIPHVTDIAYVWSRSTDDTRAESHMTSCKLTLTLESAVYQQYSKTKLVRGREFTQAEEDSLLRVCIIDEDGAKALYGNTNVIGNKVEITAFNTVAEYTIIGVRETPSSPLDSLGLLLGGIQQEKKATIEVPFKTVESYALPAKIKDIVTSIPYVMVDDMYLSSEVGAEVVRTLNLRHHITVKDEGFDYYEMSSMLSSINSIVLVITLLISFVAAIALLVGGIGVMNIMLVTVTERTREIGIRKSLGAKTKSILLQFLIESGVISLVGGTIGLVIGLGGSIILCTVASKFMKGYTLSPEFNPLFILGTMIFSMGVGVFFGVIPARKAAKLTPVEALRHK